MVLARRAGGVVPGIVWLEPRGPSEGDEDLDALAAIVGGSAVRRPARTSGPMPGRGSPTSSPPRSGGASPRTRRRRAGPTAGSVLGDLEAAGFLTVDSLDDDTVERDRPGGSRTSHAVRHRRARARGGRAGRARSRWRRASTAAWSPSSGDVYVVAPEAPGRGEALTESLDEAVLRRDRRSSTTPTSRPAGWRPCWRSTRAADGQVGLHYGYGEGADAVLPAWTPP